MSALSNADWSPVRPQIDYEEISKYLCLATVVLGVLGWFVFVVHPSDVRRERVMECVGSRVPTRAVVHECAASVQK